MVNKIPDSMLQTPGGGGGGADLGWTVVAAGTQAELEAASVAAGAGGKIYVPNFGSPIVVANWIISLNNQLWHFERGCTIQRAAVTSLPIVNITATNCEFVGGIFDGNRANNANISGSFNIAAANFRFSGNWELKNCTGWGLQGYDGTWDIRDGKISNCGYAGIFWRNESGSFIQGPKIHRVTIDRTTGYVDSGGMILNGGAGVYNCFGIEVMDCDIRLPQISNTTERDGLYYASVAVETNYCFAARIIGNRVLGGRIAYSAQTCPNIVHSGNVSTSIGDYSHEFSGIEWGIISGNSGTGVGPSIAHYGIVLSGACNGCAVVGNHSSQGFATPIADLSGSPSRPHAITGNA